MDEYPEVEITISRSGDGFAAELRTTAGDVEDMIQVKSLPLDLSALRRSIDDHEAYGNELGKILKVPEVQLVMANARGTGRVNTVRIRIAAPPADADLLHGIRWELIRDEEGPMGRRADTALSRFLPSMRWVQMRPTSRLSVLAAVSDPTNLDEYKDEKGESLEFIKRDDELGLIKQAIGTSVTFTELAGRCTLSALMARLRDGFDVLYLVCHGALKPAPAGDASRSPEPQIWLQDDTGKSAVVDGRTLALQLRELKRPPRLIILASCQSAGKSGVVRIGRNGVLKALGPRLIEAGVPAVIAMQGDVEIETVRNFFPEFFRAVARHGGVDVAMSEARAHVAGQNRADWWVPALFMRLRSGRIWYRSGFSTGAPDWDSLVLNIRNGDCTPVVGPDVCESLIGSQQEIASQIARKRKLPLSEEVSDDLAHVMQFLTVRGKKQAKTTLVESKIDILLERFGKRLDPSLRQKPKKLDDMEPYYAQLLEAAWLLQRDDGNDPYTLLAGLDCERYITADTTLLLEKALCKANKQPETAFCPWRDKVRKLPSVYDTEPNFHPSVQRPLVYYVRGRDDVPDSLVTTEDDYFSFMLGVTEYRTDIPGAVIRALSDAALIFLGFAIDNWAFRVFFRTMMNQEGAQLLRSEEYSHVAVQIDVEEGQSQDPEVARRYVMELFKGDKIDFYWGRVQEFMAELERHVHPAGALP